MDDQEWVSVEHIQGHRRVVYPHLMVYRAHQGETGVSEHRYSVRINRSAYQALHEPRYVRLFVAKGIKIKLVPVDAGGDSKLIRTVTARSNKDISIGGGGTLVKKLGMPLGYYKMTDLGVFVWEGR